VVDEEPGNLLASVSSWPVTHHQRWIQDGLRLLNRDHTSSTARERIKTAVAKSATE
jgi:hypothetical protein